MGLGWIMMRLLMLKIFRPNLIHEDGPDAKDEVRDVIGVTNVIEEDVIKYVMDFGGTEGALVYEEVALDEFFSVVESDVVLMPILAMMQSRLDAFPIEEWRDWQ